MKKRRQMPKPNRFKEPGDESALERVVQVLGLAFMAFMFCYFVYVYATTSTP